MGILSGITNLFTGGVVDGVSKIIGKFVTDPKDVLEANLALAKIAGDYQVALLNKDGELAVQQATVIKAEIESSSWMARNWRPILMLTFTFIVAFNYVICPLFTIKVLEIPPDMWGLLKLGIGGYVIGRSVEKTATIAAPVIAAKLAQ
jgi:hypothetical protein